MADRKRVSSMKKVPQKPMTLEEALRVIKENGLKVTSDAPEVFEQKVEEAPALLGAKQLPIGVGKKRGARVPKSIESTEPIKVYLHVSHGIGERTYGPGWVEFSPKDVEIASLVKCNDDKFVNQHLKKTTIRDPECFLICQATTSSGERKNMAIQVSDEFFKSDLSDQYLTSVPRDLNGMRLTVAF